MFTFHKFNVQLFFFQMLTSDNNVVKIPMEQTLQIKTGVCPSFIFSIM